MREGDYSDFAALLDATCSMLSRGAYVPNAQNTALFFRALAVHSIEAVRAGFDAHLRDPARGRFVPVPADILAQLEAIAAADGRPGPEEAWALAVRSNDEAETVVWTAEAAEAWAIARPVMALGDEVGARMAFKESYLRLVAEARAARRVAAWEPSLGHDPARRAIALDAAVACGRLKAPDAALLLPAPQVTPESLSPDVRAVLLELRERITSKPEPESIDAAEKRRTAEAKAEMARRVAEYSPQKGMNP